MMKGRYFVMMEKMIKNESLGNFGFLLDFNQEFLFELAQLAESNLYTNKRLCTVYIRQLTESFFELVINENNIKEEALNTISVIKSKQIAIVKYFTYSTFEFGKKAFPKFPGDGGDRVVCPEGEDNNPGFEGSGTLYVWDMIRRLGNAGAHAILSEKNERWLDEKYMISALQQLCYRMRCYFFGKAKQSQKYCSIDRFVAQNHPVASREVFYPVVDGVELKVNKEGGIPGYVEKMYYSVVPSSGINTTWKNTVNKYLMIRRYEIEENENVRNFLLQSQKAYLVLQQMGQQNGIAPYSVLVDLRNSSDYYISSYEFPVEPKELSLTTLDKVQAYKNVDVLLEILTQFVSIIKSLSKCRIYHRSLSHNSIKVCQYEDSRIKLFIVDFEFVKLFDGDGLTVLPMYREKVRVINEKKVISKEVNHRQGMSQYQYFEFTDDTPEDRYKEEQNKLAGKIICNFLCPAHMENFKDYDMVATREEIMSDNNLVWRSGKISHDIITHIYEIAEKLIDDSTYSLDMAEEELEGEKTNAKENR